MNQPAVVRPDLAPLIDGVLHVRGQAGRLCVGEPELDVGNMRGVLRVGQPPDVGGSVGEATPL